VDPEAAVQALRDAERQIADLQRQLAVQDEFASTLAHELRNLLAPIVMQAEYLADAARQAEEPLPTVWLNPRLEGLCVRMRKFVETFDRIMEASRLTAGHIDLRLEDVDLSGLVREISAGFEREASSARSALSVEAPPQLVGCWDRLRLQQICTNLISNAIRYGAAHPIAIAVSGDEEWASLRVQDHGIGISEADQQRIFERFERGGQQRNPAGFGIGLWIVRENCRALGGEVTVQSRPAQGSTFTVRLPRRRRTHHD
jgi:signal transduction histidine kinase